MCPETSSPWLNPISTDHVTGLTAVRSTATSAPIASSKVRTPIGATAAIVDVGAHEPFNKARHPSSCIRYGFRMRADRLVSLVLLLRQRGRLTADTLARELEVSTRTVLRDIEALSAAGVPVYAERGRHGGFALMPGFRTELTGLNHDEALALLTAGSARGEQVFGLGSALASAMRKVVDALPESHRTTASDAARRFLVEPETDLLSRRPVTEEVPDRTMMEIRRAVLAGHKLRIHYAATDQAPWWCTVDPIGLVTVRDRNYLLATRSGADRTYRLSRVLAAEELSEPAQRPNRVDLDRAWRERCAQFLSTGHIAVLIRVDPERRED
ncbi:DeoR family transcriptional regulator, partial [Streptomyces pristinaespiralis ATCC 25486]